MSTTESLHLLLENANVEVQWLEAENSKLHEVHPEQAVEVNLSREVQRLKELYEQALRNIQRKDEQASSGGDY